jgi:hypothetical protein
METSHKSAPTVPTSRRGKYITLTLLLLWVAAVFIVTVLKFAKVL